MYIDNVQFDCKSPAAKATLSVLSILKDTFQEKTPDLERYNVISLYCVVAEMLKQYAFAQVMPLLRPWFLD